MIRSVILFSKYATILLRNMMNSEYLENLSVELYDVLGRKKEIVTTVIQSGQKVREIELPRGNLPSGIYFYAIINKVETLVTGKLIIR